MQRRSFPALLVVLVVPFFVSVLINLMYAPGNILEIVFVLVYWVPLSLLTFVFGFPLWILVSTEYSISKAGLLAAICGIAGGLFVFVVTTAMTVEEGSKFSDIQSLGLMLVGGLLYGVGILGIYQMVLKLSERSKGAASGGNNA